MMKFLKVFRSGLSGGTGAKTNNKVNRRFAGRELKPAPKVFGADDETERQHGT
jgi:hypothetical protein